MDQELQDQCCRDTKRCWVCKQPETAHLQSLCNRFCASAELLGNFSVELQAWAQQVDKKQAALLHPAKLSMCRNQSGAMYELGVNRPALKHSLPEYAAAQGQPVKLQESGFSPVCRRQMWELLTHPILHDDLWHYSHSSLNFSCWKFWVKY